MKSTTAMLLLFLIACRKDNSTPTKKPSPPSYRYSSKNDTAYFIITGWSTYNPPTNPTYITSYGFKCPIDSINAGMMPTNSNNTATNIEYIGNEQCNIINVSTHAIIAKLPCEYLLTPEPATCEIGQCLFNGNLYITFTGWNNSAIYTTPPTPMTVQVIYNKYLGYY